MADFLTHIFIPLTAAYVLKPDWFKSPVYLLVGGFGLLSDVDKFLGHPGLLHSLVTLIPIAIVLVAIEYQWWERITYSLLINAIVFSHLVLDFVDAGPVPLLFPIVETGIGLMYPGQTAFGEGVLGVTIKGPLVVLRTIAPQPGFNTYGFIDGLGVASALLFLSVYVGREWQKAHPDEK